MKYILKIKSISSIVLATILLLQVMTLNLSTDVFVPLEADAQTDHNSRLYENEIKGITIQYPKNMAKIENPNPSIIVEFASPFSTISILNEIVFDFSPDLDEMAEEYVATLKFIGDITGKVKIRESQSTQIAGYPAKKITHITESDDITLLTISSFIVDNTRVYPIVFTVEQEKFLEGWESLNQILISLEINNNSIPPALQYENLSHDISIEYPSSWTYSELEESTTTVEFTPPKSNLEDVYTEILSQTVPEFKMLEVAMVTGEPKNLVLSKYVVDTIMEDYPNIISDFEIVHQDVTLAVPHFYYAFETYTGTASDDRTEIMGIVFFLVVEDKVHLLLFATEEEKFAEYLPTLLEIISSIAVDEEPFPIEFDGKYLNQEQRLKINFPEEWDEEEMKEYGVIHLGVDPEIYANLFSSKIDPNSGSMVLTFGDYEESMNVVTQCESTTSSTIIKLDEMKVLEVNGKCLDPINNIPLQTKRYIAATKDKIMTISYTGATDAAFERELSKFNESIKTLKILDTLDISDPSNYASVFGLPLTKETVQRGGIPYEINIVSNSTIDDFSFNEENQEISFRSTESTGASMTELFIGKLLKTPYTVTIDETSTDDFFTTEDKATDDIILSFEYKLPVQKITISGTLAENNQISTQNNPDLKIQEIPTENSPNPEQNNPNSKIPDWIRNNAKWWAGGNIDDSAFVGGIQYLIKEDVLVIPHTQTSVISDIEGSTNESVTEHGHLIVLGDEFFIAEDEKINIRVSGKYLDWQSDKGRYELLLIDPQGFKDKILLHIDKQTGEFSEMLQFDHFALMGEYTIKGIFGGEDIGSVKFILKSGSEKKISLEPEIPSWIKNNADWWSQGLISDDDFLKGIKFMVENGIIIV